MLSPLIAISGMLGAHAAVRAGTAPAAVEISFVTHAGEGAAGRKRVTRDGCYQAESGGSTGGATYARDSQAGCHAAADVAPVFARLDAIAADTLAREGPSTGAGSPGGLAPGGADTNVVLIRPDGTRWVAANRATADDMLRAINELPGENQWYAPPPVKPVGAGPQLVVLSATSSRVAGSRFEAALASDGRWWCHRSTVGEHAPDKLPVDKRLTVADAPARLGRILAGAHASAPAADAPVDAPHATVEVAWPARARAPLSPTSLGDAVVQRFSAEMRSLAPACAPAPEAKR